MIQDWAKQATNRKLPEHIRYNYVQVLTVIREFCDTAIRSYNNERKK